MINKCVNRRHLPVSAALAACLVLPHAAQGTTLGFETVVLSGQQAPGVPSGTLFEGFTFNPVVLNAVGQTAFRGALSTSSPGLFSEGSGTLALVARTGGQVPGEADGVRFGSLFINNPLLNDAGQTGFLSRLNGTDVDRDNDFATFIAGADALVQVARQGDQGPGQANGVLLTGVSLRTLNDSGQTVFFGSLGPGLGVGADGIYSNVSGTPPQVAAVGNQVPGEESGINFGSLSSFPRLNDSGQIVFNGRFDDPNNDSQTAIFSDVSGSLVQVLRRGDRVPDANSGVVFSGFSRPDINTNGQIAFLGQVTGPGLSGRTQGFYRGGAGALIEVAREGQQAPGAAGGVVFDDFRGTEMFNDAGQIGFSSRLRGPSVDDTNDIGIYLGSSRGTLTQVARTGSQAPGTPSGVVFSGFGAFTGSSAVTGRDNLFNDFALKNSGQVAFLGNLTGMGIDAFNDTGIYATSLEGQLIEIIREGDLFDVNQDPLIEDLRIVEQLSFSTGFQVGDEGSGFNDLGQLAFSPTAARGSSSPTLLRFPSREPCV